MIHVSIQCLYARVYTHAYIDPRKPFRTQTQMYSHITQNCWPQYRQKYVHSYTFTCPRVCFHHPKVTMSSFIHVEIATAWMTTTTATTIAPTALTVALIMTEEALVPCKTNLSNHSVTVFPIRDDLGRKCDQDLHNR